MSDNEPKVYRLTPEMIERGFKASFGMSREEAWKAGVCIQCRKPPTFQTEAGRREYKLSALCEPCFDEMWKEDS